MSTAKSALRGRFFDTKPSEIKVGDESFLLAPVPMALRTRLLGLLDIKPGKQMKTDVATTWDVGTDILFECLMVEKEGGGYERVFEGPADRKTLKEGVVTDVLLKLAQASIERLFPAVSKEELDAMGKGSKTTETSTSSSTTSANTDDSSTPADT